MLSFNKLFFLLKVLHLVVAEECKTESSDSFEKALHRKLLCNYDKSLRPVRQYTTTTNVSVLMDLRSIHSSYDRASIDTVQLGAWITLIWEDEYLAWDPALYGGLNSTLFDSSTIWMPDFAMHSSDTVDVIQVNKPCCVTDQGLVTCVEQVSHSAFCRKNYQKWPFDTQTCSVQYGTWMDVAQEVNLTSQWKNHVEQGELRKSKYWTLLSMNATDEYTIFYNGTPDATHITTISYTLVLKRNAATLAVEYGTPIFVLMVLTLGSLCLSINSIERIIIMLVNTCLHINYIHTISYVAPAVGKEVPDAVIYIRDALLLSCIILIHGVAVRAIIKKRDTVPNWIINITGIIDTEAGKIMFHEFDPALPPSTLPDDLENQSSSQRQTTNSRDWKRFAMFLNRIFFIFVVLFYVYITIRYLA